ncbi:hypothetical protein [Niabella hirudinis]|uniref:hypothetical protein n=1 Tax=Niabella hirudinis TaxID=1285929 RepID=UPI003EB93423
MRRLLLMHFFVLSTCTYIYAQENWVKKDLGNFICSFPNLPKYSLKNKLYTYTSKGRAGICIVMIQNDVVPRYSDFLKLKKADQEKAIDVLLSKAAEGLATVSGSTSPHYRRIMKNGFKGVDVVLEVINPATGDMSKQNVKLFYTYNQVYVFSYMLLNYKTASFDERDTFFNGINAKESQSHIDEDFTEFTQRNDLIENTPSSQLELNSKEDLNIKYNTVSSILQPIQAKDLVGEDDPKSDKPKYGGIQLKKGDDISFIKNATPFNSQRYTITEGLDEVTGVNPKSDEKAGRYNTLKIDDPFATKNATPFNSGAYTVTEGLGELMKYDPDANYIPGIGISQERIDDAKRYYYEKKVERIATVIVPIILISLLVIFLKRNKKKFSVNKNPDYFKNSHEKDAAELLFYLLRGELPREEASENIEKLSIGLYYDSFKRTSKEIVPLEQLGKIFEHNGDMVQSVKINLALSSVFATIKKAITNAYDNTLNKTDEVTIEKCNMVILHTLTNMATLIESSY